MVMFIVTLPPVYGIGFLPASFVVAVFYVAIYAVGVLYIYKRLIKKVKSHYPLAYPNEPDVYFPRSNIPRPIYLDVIEHPEYFEKREETEPVVGG